MKLQFSVSGLMLLTHSW